MQYNLTYTAVTHTIFSLCIPIYHIPADPVKTSNREKINDRSCRTNNSVERSQTSLFQFLKYFCQKYLIQEWRRSGGEAGSSWTDNCLCPAEIVCTVCSHLCTKELYSTLKHRSTGRSNTALLDAKSKTLLY